MNDNAARFITQNQHNLNFDIVKTRYNVLL